MPKQVRDLTPNGFDDNESMLIVGKLLERNGTAIRERFPDSSRFRELLTGDAAAIASRLDQSQTFQISLLAADTWIVSAIEELIDTEQIKIPATEIRTPTIVRPSNSWNSVACQCSRLGIRFDASTYDSSLPRLRSLITQLYRSQTEIESLDFRLRHLDGKSLNEKLESYIYRTHPREIVSNLIFVSQSHIQSCFEVLRYGHFSPPTNEVEEKALIDRILWKLGFNLPLFPTFQATFWNRLERFLQSSRTFRPYGDSDEEAIRSAGINLFVSLEEILDYSLSFSTWALLADHYGTTRWTFNLEESRSFMVQKLNGRPIGEHHRLELDSRGRNGLYALIEGFRSLAGLCDELTADPARYERPRKDFPGFAGRSEVERFPFLHTALLLDLEATDRDQILSLLRTITRELNIVDVPNLRNRLGHNRDDFPRQQEIETCCAQLTETISKLEESGLLPTVRLRHRASYDEFGRGDVTLLNFRDAEFHVFAPSQLAACQLPVYSGWIIVAPSMHIGESSELARFRFREASTYRELWKDFPKRRVESAERQLESLSEGPGTNEVGELANH
jgi:hypothetical protein